jgi:hypothetical protein
MKTTTCILQKRLRIDVLAGSAEQVLYIRKKSIFENIRIVLTKGLSLFLPLKGKMISNKLLITHIG